MKTFLILVAVFGIACAIGGFCRFEFADPNKTCTLCHEICDSQKRMAVSPHKDVNCKDCHGGTLEAFADNLKRTIKHFKGVDYSKFGNTFMLSERQVADICLRCAKCHQAEAAQWKASGHGKPASVFLLDEKHNAAWKPADNCMQCHGMFLEGDIETVVARKDLSDRPAIPCLACHGMHHTDTLRFFNRSVGESQPAKTLLLQKIVEKDGGREIRRSPDARNRLCVTCHAANAEGIAGSSDDRTPVGAQEGMGCMDCHSGHGRKADSSRGRCPVKDRK